MYQANTPKKIINIAKALVPMVLLGAFSAQSSADSGRVMLHGGGSVKEIMYDKWVEVAGGAGSRICIFGTNSSNPQGAIDFYVDKFSERGATPVPIDIRVSNSAWNTEPFSDGAFEFTEVRTTEDRLTNDPDTVAQVQSCDAVWFGGGNQSRAMFSLLNEDGSNTPVANAIHEVLAADGAFGGTSAGAAMQSHPIIVSGVSLDSLSVPQGDSAVITRPGLGVLPEHIMVDQHFLARGRMGRLFAAMKEHGKTTGIGIDEATAVVLDLGNETWEVLGENQVMIMNAKDIDNSNELSVHLLGSGDNYDAATDVVDAFTPLTDITTRPYFITKIPFHLNLFGEYTIPSMLTRLMDTQDMQSATGVAFSGNSEFSFGVYGVSLTATKSDDSEVYYCLSSCRRNYPERSVNPARYTLSHVDVTLGNNAIVMAQVRDINDKKERKTTRKAMEKEVKDLLK